MPWWRKEFVAARTDLNGVVVLSNFTEAARELTEVLSVNPYDLEDSSEAPIPVAWFFHDPPFA